MIAYLFFFCLVSMTAHATDYYVAPGGSDEYPGNSSEPFETIQHAADVARAGDTIHVRTGTYYESVLFIYPGSENHPIQCRAEGNVLIDSQESADWGIHIDGYEDSEARYIVIQGFQVTGAQRGGIRVSWANRVTVSDCTCFDNGRWGIFTDYSDDLLIENNTCNENRAEHGIYVSNSGDRPIIRSNRCFNNNASGIQINADPAMEGDGITSNALIEKNICWGNGSAGGAAINLASVRDSLIRNNLLYDNAAGGIAGWGDGNGPEWGCKNNRFFNNIIVFNSGEGRWCISLKEGSTNALIYNNILIGGSRGGFEFTGESLPGLAMDYNILFSRDDSIVVTEEDNAYYTFSQWQAMGYDLHSKSAGPDEIFRDLSQDDYHHRSDSPGIDCGTDSDPWIPADDIEGNSRWDDPSTPNEGAGEGYYDLGCYEYRSGTPGPTPTPPISSVEFSLDMGAIVFSPGQACYLDLTARNKGPAAELDCYIILDVYGAYWSYPSWRSLSNGLDHGSITFNSYETATLHIIPVFSMPHAGAVGPLYFYAAGFTSGELSAAALQTNVASYEFYIQTL